MTRAEQKAFEKWIASINGAGSVLSPSMLLNLKSAFLAGYRAGFEAQHYEVDDGKL